MQKTFFNLHEGQKPVLRDLSYRSSAQLSQNFRFLYSL